jgi:CheY-like chemotaxis protein
MSPSKKILIADDDRGAAAVLSARLRALGHETLGVAPSLGEAVELAARETPALVLLGLQWVDSRTGGVANVRQRFPGEIVFLTPSAAAGAAAGLEPVEFLVRGGTERELQLVLAGAWSRQTHEARVREFETRLQADQTLSDLGRVAYRVAHDFNNLLMGITSASSLLRIDLPVDSPLAEHVEKIDAAVERGAESCRQLLSHVRREAVALSGQLPTETSTAGREINPTSSSRASAPRPGIVGAVLIVDDDDSVRALARWVVEKAGRSAVTARDGDEALEKFRADPGAFSLVLLDLTMPRMSGEEVLVGLRSIRPGVPVVVITGYGEESVREDALADTAGFLQKPFSPDALRAVLKRCADTRP